MDTDVTYPSSCFAWSGSCGFSLIELLIAIAIAAILFGVASPSLSEFTQNNRLTGHINQLVSHLNYARSAAIKGRNNVVVCKSPDGTNCDKQGDWEDGWILFVDSDNNREHSDTEILLAVQPSLGHDLKINYGAFPSNNYVLYYPTGLSLGNGTFTFCDHRGDSSAKAIVLYKTGRLRIARTMPNGNPLRCDT